MKTITSSVGFQDTGGNLLVNGSIIFTLSPGVYLISPGGGQVVGVSFIVNLTAIAKIPDGVQVWASDELNGSPLYSATLCRMPNGISPLATVTWLIAGASPIDLSLLPQH